ncbi:cardiolipin synthase ClsB [Pseudazoarcus pumilus]|uniref:Cardiolipin synthase B n=1 Tax=Pseudazoarcus pumilus TaxID=2067960 RepID=A0A2I6S4X6_9RHOO|nr:cardiolipin synthase ClsB [Pseudazoarcus pumilus]AUN94309.1 cardiolipin synthase ClsB [Pseudazoarcus pumilus]
MTAFLGGNRVVLLENGERYFPDVIEACEAATREIHVETYLFENDATGRRMADVLMRAARRGVCVRVMVDGFGARPFVEELMSEVRAAGVEVLVYRRDFGGLRIKRHRLRRLHRKIITVDRRIAWVGGINIIDDYSEDAPLHPRYDYAVRVEGPLVGAIVHAVHHLWWLVSWASLRRRGARPRAFNRLPVRPGDVRAAFLVRDNLRHRRDIEEAYLAAIARAHKEIVIACAYFFPGRAFRQALVDASARGVCVILLLQGLSDHPMLAYATRALYPYFLDNGIRLFEYHRSHLHAKVAVVDRRWATVGSSNIDPFSLLLAREANVVVDHVGFAGELRDSLDRALQVGAQELRHEDWHRLPRLQRFASWCAYQLVRLVIGIAGYRGMH